ncbi:MAG TPA: UvrD-helicase domain-containing protein, partial [Propionibacteriaceae bacterium]
MTAAPTVQGSFDVCGPLPVGTTVLEASAGTGKTYTIAALAARYVAEGHARLDELMLVTFGRMATNELRQRVRDRLVGVERGLARALAGEPPQPHADEVEQLLTAGRPEELRARHHRIARSLSDFDTATIATTHEFCLRMLDELGILGDREPDVVFVEHLSELTREVVADVYLRRYAAAEQLPPLSYDEAQRIALQAVDDLDTRLVPAHPSVAAAEPTSGGWGSSGPVGAAGVALERVAFVHEVRAEVRRRKDLGRLFTYDDMLTRLRDALADPVLGAAAAGRLRQRYRMVLVDEFQDTDPVQWDILRRAFHRHATLVLIGDPKQAIYAFRGADVFSYLDAVTDADHTSTLATNYRSDQPLVAALGTLMGGAALGHDRIVVKPVTASWPERRLSRVTGPPSPHPTLPDPTTPPDTTADLTAPVRIRIFPHDADAERMPTVGRLRPKIVDDLVADVTAVLGSDLRLDLDGRSRP